MVFPSHIPVPTIAGRCPTSGGSAILPGEGSRRGLMGGEEGAIVAAPHNWGEVQVEVVEKVENTQVKNVKLMKVDSNWYKSDTVDICVMFINT